MHVIVMVAAISSTAFIRAVSDRVLDSLKEVRKKAEDAVDKATQADDKATKADDKAQTADQKASEAMNEAQDASKALSQAVESDSDDEGAEESRADSTDAARELSPIALNPDEAAVLTALTTSRFLLRSASGLAAESHKSRAEMMVMLERLEARELVEQKTYKGGVRWVATESGKRAQR